MEQKTIEVVAALICRGNAIFATRGYGEWKDWWEVPGGKIEADETPAQALRREIREELDTEILVDKYLTTIEWDYPKFHLVMHCYLCSLLDENLHLMEHEAARWLTADTLRSVRWLPADDQLLPLIERQLPRPCLVDQYDDQFLRILELSGHFGVDAPFGIVDFGPAPELFLGVVLQTREQDGLVQGSASERFVGVLYIQSQTTVGVVGVLHPEDGRLKGIVRKLNHLHLINILPGSA